MELYASRLGRYPQPAGWETHQQNCTLQLLQELQSTHRPWAVDGFEHCRLELSSFGKLGYWLNNFDTMNNAFITLFEQMARDVYVYVYEIESDEIMYVSTR